MKHFNIHSISVKMALSMLVAGIVLLTALSFALPNVFYSITRSELDQQTSGKISDAAILMSYALTQHNNARILLEGTNPEEPLTMTSLKLLLRAWCTNPNNHKQLLPSIVSQISSTSYAVYETGSGLTSNTLYMVLFTEQGDCFYADEAADLAEYLQGTYGALLCETENDDAFYLPVFSLDSDDTEYFCFVLPFDAMEYHCAMVAIADFATIRAQMLGLTQIGIEDYQLLCHDTVIYSHLSESSIDLSNETLFSGSQFQTVEHVGSSSVDYAVLCSNAGEGLYLAVHVPNDVFLIPYSPFFRIIRVLLAAGILLLILISIVIVRLSLVRLKRLNAAMAQIQGGNYDFSLTDSSLDEVGVITRTTSKMLCTIREETERTIQHEREKKRMQYLLLVSAIDPHFIYNTLDIVSFLAAMGRTEDVVIVNKALIGTLRGRMSMKAGRIFDTVAAERSALDQYMTIQHYLCANRITYHFDAPDDVLQMEIPKNIIQPLVENAIKHGLLTHKEADRVTVMDGEILVRVRAADGKIRIEVHDNGSGMSEEAGKKYSQESITFQPGGEHIGINNIRARLNYLYAGDYTFRIESAADKGTTITIEIPELREMESVDSGM